MTQLEEANQALRQAVADRLASTPPATEAENIDRKFYGHTPMAASLAGCKPAQEAAARCFDTTTQSVPATPEESTPVPSIPVDWILQGERELRQQRLTGDGVKNAPSDNYSEWQPTAFQGDAAKTGTTSKFGTGAVRSDTFEEFRYDLVSPIGLREVARACAEGATKYGDWNWEKGMPVHDLLNHAIAHIYGFLSGDRSEPHLGHAAWNVLAAIHSHELWPQLNAGTMRDTNCKAPQVNACDQPLKKL